MRRRGFTFVELLVAMAVSGILAAVAVPRYRLFKERAYLANMKTELGNLRVAEEAFWAENHAYSADTTELDWNGSSDVDLTITVADPYAGFTATITHRSSSSLSCTTFVGRDATTTPSGDIVCTSLAASNGGAAIPP